MIQLRSYQQEFIDNVREQFTHGHRRVVGVAPCGAGKTIMTGWMIKQALKRGNRSIFFVHRKELIAQTARAFIDLDIPFGIISADCPMQLDLPVQIASVQTLARRIDKIPPPNFLICDECHHILANTYKQIIDTYPEAFLLGVTATPQRMGGITLADTFSSMVISLSVNELIELGNLTKFQYFAATHAPDLSNVHTKFGEYNQKELADIMNATQIIGDIVKEYHRRAEGKSAICYCVNVAHSKAVAQSFRDAGIPAAHCDGDTPAPLRNKIVNDFRQGKLKVLCNAELFGEGFDVPNMQAVILARPTKSLTLFIQQAMRPLRPDPCDPDKVAIIVDHVGNYTRHGLPNSPHKWTLKPNEEKTRFCPTCNKDIVPIKKSGSWFCPECGYKFPKGEAPPPRTDRKIINVDGLISEVDVDFDNMDNQPPIVTVVDELLHDQGNHPIGWVAYRAAEAATSYNDLLYIAEVCGYKPGWAWHQWQELKNGLQIARHVC